MHFTDKELSYLAHLIQCAPVDATAEKVRSSIAQKIENAERARAGLPPRVTDEQLQQLRFEAVREGKHDLAEACNDAAFARCPRALTRCSHAIQLRSLQRL